MIIFYTLCQQILQSDQNILIAINFRQYFSSLQQFDIIIFYRLNLDSSLKESLLKLDHCTFFWYASLLI